MRGSKSFACGGCCWRPEAYLERQIVLIDLDAPVPHARVVVFSARRLGAVLGPGRNVPARGLELVGDRPQPIQPGLDGALIKAWRRWSFLGGIECDQL